MADKLKLRNSQTKKKTTAYEIRKERKRNLVDQVKGMQKELDELKFRLLVKQGQVGKVNIRAQSENIVLHEFIQEQHLAFATTQAALTRQVQRSLGSLQPAQSVIHLCTDRAERHKTLMALRERKLDYAERYLATRSQGLDPASLYYQEERFDAPDRDYCVVRFETMPIRGANVSEVFDAILGSVLNAEMFLSEIFGSITVREDNEFENADFAQIRLASAISTGAIVESNTVVFSRFVEGGDDGHGSDYGVMATDFVDSDELYPYKTGKRVRGDTTTMVMAQSFPRATKGNGCRGCDVVVTRWTYLRIHRSNVNASQDPELEMRESSVCWGDTAKKCVEQQLVHTTTPESD